jgi:hypothetical protein
LMSTGGAYASKTPSVGFVNMRPRRPGMDMSSPSRGSPRCLQPLAQSPFRAIQGAEFTPPTALHFPGVAGTDGTPNQCCDQLLGELTMPSKNPESVFAYRQAHAHTGDQDLSRQIGEESCINPMAFMEGGDWEHFARQQRPAAAISKFTSSDASGHQGSPDGSTSVHCAQLRRPTAPCGSIDSVSPLVSHAGSQLSVSAAFSGMRGQRQAGNTPQSIAPDPDTATPGHGSAACNGAFRALMTSPDAQTAQEVARMIWGSTHAPASSQAHALATLSSTHPIEDVCRVLHAPIQQRLRSPSLSKSPGAAHHGTLIA